MQVKTKTDKKRPEIDGINIWCRFDELLDLPRLMPNPANPNTHSEDQINRLAVIIKFQGWRNPIIVSNRSGFITKGHARLAAALVLNLSKVPVEYQDYNSEAEEWADIIADNKIAELAEWDFPKLNDFFLELDAQNFNMDLTGFTQLEIGDLMSNLREKSVAVPTEQYAVICECDDEKQQKEVYELLIKKSYKCRLTII